MNSVIPSAEHKNAIEHVYRFYAGLSGELDREVGLGGMLLYAGELDCEGCHLVRAANIAGAASLSATADTAAQRKAIRDGVIDFLVTSLDEALRILKNEIRKRNAVAVGVSTAPPLIANEMRERGVSPDLVRPSSKADEIAIFVAQGAKVVTSAALPEGWTLNIFIDPPSDFEARALDLIGETSFSVRRWLRLSPRYLGPPLRRVRSLACDAAAADKLRASGLGVLL